MDIKTIKKYINSKVVIFLKTSFKYTCIIISVNGTTVTIKDKFNRTIEIDSTLIGVITPQ